MEAGMEGVTLRNLLRPPLVGPWYHALLNRRAKGLRVGLANRISMWFIGHPLEQAAAKDRVEFDAVETDRCDVQRAAANLLVSVVDGLLDPQAALALCAGKIADDEARGRQPAADDRVHKVCQRECQSVRFRGAWPGHSGAEADEKRRQFVQKNECRFLAD